jgi:Ca-activated chloride channel family protein
MITDFHFLRPLWLVAIIPSIVLWWFLLRRGDTRRAWRGIVAGHLVPFMVADAEARTRRMRPVTLLGPVLLLTCLALAGPTWLQEPAPFADDEAALVIAVEVTPTMLAQDIQPSRLERASQKIKELLARRKGASAALIAFAGTAHLVLPLTEDGDLVAAFAAELHPEQMPVAGDAAEKALGLARTQLADAGRPGSILLVTDSVSPAAVERIAASRETGAPRMHVYGVAAGPEAVVPPGSPPAPPIDRDGLQRAARAGGGSVVFAAPDERDVDKLSRIVETQFTPAVTQGGERWRDLGFWLVPAIAVLMVPWFRRGWVVRHG